MSSSSGHLLQLAAAAAVCGGGLLVRAVKNQKRLRKIADTPRSKVASAPQGFVELEGFAWNQQETIATIDNEEAVYYSLELQREEDHGTGNERRKTWTTVFNFEHSFPFYLLDPTGLAVVQPFNADSDFTNTSSTLYSKLSIGAKLKVDALVNGTVTHFPPSRGLGSLFSYNYRVVEKKLLLGSPLYASGTFKTESFNQITIDDSLATFAHKVIDFNSRSLKNVKSLLDTNQDGKVSAKEAIVGYSTAARVSRTSPKTVAAPIEIFGTLSTSENYKLFFSDMHEQQLIEDLAKFQSLKLAGGSALVASSICAALLQFGIIVNPFESAQAAKIQKQTIEQQKETEKRRQEAAYRQACAAGQQSFCATTRQPSSNK